MKLQTQIPLEPAAHQFGYDHKFLLLGSCFAQNIGDKLAYYKFQNIQADTDMRENIAGKKSKGTSTKSDS